MQVNLLSNYCLFFSIIQSEECYKILSHLNTMPVIKLLNKQLTYFLYDSKREGKFNIKPIKDKNQSNEYDFTVIEDEDYCFVFNKEKNWDKIGDKNRTSGKDGHMAIVNKNFFQLPLFNKIFGQRTLVRTKQIIFQVINWQGFIIYHTELDDNQTLLMIQQKFSSPIVPSLTEDTETLKKMNFLFEPILLLLMGDNRAIKQLANYQKQLSRIKSLHPQIIKEIDKEKGLVEINFSLIFYYVLANAPKMSN